MTETVVAPVYYWDGNQGRRRHGATTGGGRGVEDPRGTGPPLPPVSPPHDGCLDRVLRMFLTTHSIVLRASHVARIWSGGGA